jgi:hypothetical protein
MSDLEPIDLSPLRPGDPARERMVRAVAARTAPALARRAAPRSPLLLLAGWARPALAAAAVVAAVSLAALAAVEPPSRIETVAERLPADGDPADAWMVEPREPNETDLIRTLEGDAP